MPRLQWCLKEKVLLGKWSAIAMLELQRVRFAISIFKIQFAGAVMRGLFPDLHTAISIFKIEFAVVTTASTYPKGIFYIQVTS